MGTSRTVDQLIHKLDRAAEEVAKARVKALTQIGRDGKLTMEAARGSVLGGKDHFSGWAKAPLTVRTAVTEASVSVLPGRAGPWRVLNDGRHQGTAGGFAGPGINHKTGVTARKKNGGVRATRAVKGKHWNGVTDGKHTWDEGAQLIVEQAPKKIQSNVHAGLEAVFGHG